MQIQTCRLLLALFAVGSLTCGIVVNGISAQEATDVPAPGASNQAAAGDKAQDPFAVPTGGAKELIGFIREKMAFRPTSREEGMRFQAKGIPALKEAAEKLKQIVKPEDQKIEGYADAMAFILYLDAATGAATTAKDKAQLTADIKTALESSDEPSPYAVQAAMTAAMRLEQDDPKAAAGAFRDFGAILAKNKNPQFAKFGTMLEGSARRLDLPGNTMEISGTPLDGSKFDWAKYRGKVVLVDFWATWCGPCIAELPNVKHAYEEYNKRGFDVVGISLDQDKATLEEFVAKEKTPWTVLYDGDANPVAARYGVMAIPTAILVNKEGKVVSMNARGPELGIQLEKLLGPIAERPE